MTNLQKTRHVAGLSQRELADKSGVSLKVIQKYEQGVVNINNAAAITVIKLALALECGVFDILEEDKELLDSITEILTGGTDNG